MVGAGLVAATPATGAAEAPDERDQVAAVARDYLEGWHTADPDRMGRALHPDMVSATSIRHHLVGRWSIV
jgi:hypothetical protein